MARQTSTLTLNDVLDQVGQVLAPEPVESLTRARIPHEKQGLFIDSLAKRKVVRAGRRGGKTTGVAILAVRYFMRGRRVLYGVPTQEQIDRFWYEVNEALRAAIDDNRYHKNEVKKAIEAIGTRARIRAKTCWNADTLRGDDADLLILDEFQLMNEDAWSIVGAPMLLDNDGDAVFVYTPPSLHSRSVSKATDPQHASKMFERASKDTTGRWATFHFTSYDNPHLSIKALGDVALDMTSAAIRQEILAEDNNEDPSALWSHELIDSTRVRPDQVPALERITIGVDPSGSEATEVGIVVAGRGGPPVGKVDDGGKHTYILADASLIASRPLVWAQVAVNQYYERRADRLYGERNYGGDMVQSTIRQAEGGEGVSYKDANATRGKIVRAEPVAAAYERGLVHHVGEFKQLETEMCTYVPGNKSPNRMDGLVWAALPLVEGEGVLGLLEYFKTGGAAKELTEISKPPDLAQPIVEARPACPECQSTMIVRAGNGLHCNNCQITWNPKPANGNGHAMSRGEWLDNFSGQR